MPRGRLIGLAFLILTFVLAGLILTDALPYLRGPAPETNEWFWPYELQAVPRWWGAILGGFLLLLVGYWWDRKAPDRTWPLIFVIGLTLGLQVGIIYAARPNVGAELVDRTLSKDTLGYAAVAGEISDLNVVLANFPALMTTFDNEHVRTHPPGLIVLHWLIDGAFQASPDLAISISRPARLWRCTDLWVLSRPPATVASLLINAWLPVVAAALVPWAAYGLSRSLYGRKRARWSALFSAVIPALLIFSPTPDQVFALLSVLSLWLVSSALERENPVRWAVGGMVLSLMTMLSIGNAAWVIVVLVWIVWALVRSAHWPRMPMAGLLLFVIGLVSTWAVYWLGWGVAPWEVIFTGLDQHRQLVTDFRSYPLWLLYNPLDFFLFAGLAVAAGLIFQSIVNVRGITENRTKAGPLALILLVTLVALNLSGGTRGEVGRIWLVFMPVTAVVAVDYWTRATKDRVAMMLMLASQLALVLAIGLAWQPIRAIILPVVPPSYPPLPEVMTSVGIDFQASGAERITLEAFQITDNDNPPALDVMLTWSSDRPTTEPYVVFVHLLDAGGNLAAQHDGWPVEGSWPTTCWNNGEMVVDSHPMTLPESLSPGTYSIVAGIYNGQTGTRLNTADGRDLIQLGEITIEP